MLTQYHVPVSLCFLATDLPILINVESAATLYQKQPNKYHLVLKADFSPQATNQLIWLELSSSRVIMTVQGDNQLNYRHFWEKGVYGTSRYWLNQDSLETKSGFCLPNYTRSLDMEQSGLPRSLRVEYELWSHLPQILPPGVENNYLQKSKKICLGHYVLHLEIEH